MDGESLNILKHGWGYTCPVSTVGIFNKCYEATRQNTSASVFQSQPFPPPPPPGPDRPSQLAAGPLGTRRGFSEPPPSLSLSLSYY